ncbi:MAG: Pr6Pr family membrane protein [Pseudomonadota bacterium]|nr:Pr6Pr family membrane protein [Pseudomonadota bacterium]
MPLSPLARSLALIVALLAVASLVAQFTASQITHPDEGLFATLWRLGRFFTILTNAMVAVTFAVLTWRGRVTSPVWLGGVALWIAITGVVYHLLLSATDSQTTVIGWWANIGVHTAVPLATFAWWLGFAPRRGLSVTAAALWMLWPTVYVCYALARGQMDGIYPYFFTDPNKVGWSGVVTWIVILATAFFVAGLAQIALARIIRHR